MPALDAATLLAVWEEGSAQPMVRRAVTVLAAARPDRSGGEWAVTSVGQRDSALLEVQEELAGDRLEVTTECPRCRERLEVSFSTRDLRAGPATPPPPELGVDTLGYRVDYRLPTTEDLWATAGDPSNGKVVVLRRCITAAWLDGSPVDADSLPDAVLDAVVEGMARADPMAEVQLELACGACFHRWSTSFDILRYLWGELEDRATRVLLEVHALASAYGWSEAEILSLGPRRRQSYLDLLGT